MGRHWKWLPLVALAGCGVATMQVSEVTEEERNAQIEHGLGAKLRAEFGPTARVNHVVDEKAGVLVGVALEAAPVDGDELPPVAFALYDAQADKLQVIAKDANFREARMFGQQPALVSQNGELFVGSNLVANNVKGDLSVAEGRLMLTLNSGEDEGETSIAVVDSSGAVQQLADAAGVDDRPTISPDGKTVIFVSGRSGVTSFYRTSLTGGAPVQLTNKELNMEPVSEIDAVTITEDGLADDGANEAAEDKAPANFVPTPVHAERMWWVDADTLRYDAGGGEYWRLNIRTGAALREAK